MGCFNCGGYSMMANKIIIYRDDAIRGILRELQPRSLRSGIRAVQHKALLDKRPEPKVPFAPDIHQFFL
jgi:hypothetical protein